jgi:outer membrane protein, multidrug efflux system
MKRLAFGPTLFLLLTGCMGVRPQAPSATHVSIPPDWRNSHDAGPLVKGQWWELLGDPVLTELVQAALLENDDIGIASTRVTEARALERLSQAARLPSVSLDSSPSRQAGISPFGFPDQQTQTGFDVTIGYDADLFGRLRQRTQAARAATLASSASRDAVILAVVATAAGEYIRLRALDARLEVIRKTIQARQDSLTVARRLERAGYSSALELRQAESEYDATLALLPAAELATVKQETVLALLCGSTPRTFIRGKMIGEFDTPPIPSELPSALLRHRPDVFAAEQALVAADHQLDADRAAFLPNFSLAGVAGKAYSNLYPDPIAIWSIGGSVLAPLFEGGRLHAQADLAAARRDQAAFEYRHTVLQAFREVEDALASTRDYDLQVQALIIQQEALQRSLILATNRYRAGYAPYLDQLDAQRGLLSAELSVIDAQAGRLMSYVDLYRAMGGAWSATGAAQ